MVDTASRAHLFWRLVAGPARQPRHFGPAAVSLRLNWAEYCRRQDQAACSDTNLLGRLLGLSSGLSGRVDLQLGRDYLQPIGPCVFFSAPLVYERLPGKSLAPPSTARFD